MTKILKNKMFVAYFFKISHSFIGNILIFNQSTFFITQANGTCI
jgi:hypothetical protein